MKEAVFKFSQKHGLIRAGDRVLVAVSGGADSTALLHLLHGLAPRLSTEIRAAHLDHAIRPESAGDAEFVESLCGSLDIPLRRERIDVPALARERRAGLEETAREVRRRFLERTAGEQGCQVIALGHNRGDQAETFLHRLVRGTSLAGLAAMRPKDVIFVRPLLPFSRMQILEYLKAEGLPWVEDGSNADTRYTRNRIRHQLMPGLRTFNPRIEEQLFRLTRLIALEEDFWEGEVRSALEKLGHREEGGFVLSVEGLLELHPALRARVLGGALKEVRGDVRGLSSRHFAALEELVGSPRPQMDLHLPRAMAARRYGKLRISPGTPSSVAPFAAIMEAPGLLSLPVGEMVLSVHDRAFGESRWAVEFSADRVPFPLEVRSFRPGDRFHPAGMSGTKKLKDFFIDAKVDREVRRHVPLLVCGGEILWVVGMRRREGRRPGEDGRPVLRAEFRPLTTDNPL